MNVAPSLAWNVQQWLRNGTLERPGPVVVGDDHVARSSASTSIPIRVAIFDTPGSRTDRSSGDGQARPRTVTGYALVEARPADTLVPTAGDLVHWQGQRFEVSTASRWASGDEQDGEIENSETFFEFTASRVVTR